jgi:diguanylate cyclase (GGDEF)-like protein
MTAARTDGRMTLIEMLDAAAVRCAGWPRSAVVLLGLAGVALTGLADWWTGSEWAFTLLYLLPITYVTWIGGRRTGLFVAACSSLTWLFTDALTHPAYLSPLSRYWDLGIQAGVFAFVAMLLASLREHLDTERALARHDALTGLANRRHFFELAAREVARARRDRLTTAVIYLDVDDFKRVNDTWGHEIGDRLLVRVGSTLRDGVRAVDVVARLGGDEFALLLPDTAEEAVRILVARLRVALEESMAAEGWPVSFSMGAAVFDAAGAEVERMLRQADHLMYEAKADGKGGFRLGYFANDVHPDGTRLASGPPASGRQLD